MRTAVEGCMLHARRRGSDELEQFAVARDCCAVSGGSAASSRAPRAPGCAGAARRCRHAPQPARQRRRRRPAVRRASARPRAAQRVACARPSSDSATASRSGSRRRRASACPRTASGGAGLRGSACCGTRIASSSALGHVQRGRRASDRRPGPPSFCSSCDCCLSRVLLGASSSSGVGGIAEWTSIGGGRGDGMRSDALRGCRDGRSVS